jgi:tetratricopeptide (TPR) repeat protein
VPTRSAAAHHETAIALAAQYRFTEAIAEYLESARLEPDVSRTFYNLGVAYGELSQWKAAIEAYKRAIQLDPNDWQAHSNLAMALSHPSSCSLEAAQVGRCCQRLGEGNLPLPEEMAKRRNLSQLVQHCRVGINAPVVSTLGSGSDHRPPGNVVSK